MQPTKQERTDIDGLATDAFADRTLAVTFDDFVRHTE
jgi:hypothetical protein